MFKNHKDLDRKEADRTREQKRKIVEFLKELGFICVSNSSSFFKQIYVKSKLVILIEEKI